MRELLTVALEDAENLVAGNGADLCDTVRVPQNYANLRRGQALLCELANLVFHLAARKDICDQRKWLLKAV